MFYIANNIIHISRGDTPTYRVKLVDTNGVPYRLFRKGEQGMKDVIVSFTVRENLWETGDNFKFKYNLLFSQKPVENGKKINGVSESTYMFETTEVGDYNQLFKDKGIGTPIWTGAVFPGDKPEEEDHKLYQFIDSNYEYSYRYYQAPVEGETEGKWIPYEFVVQFQFDKNSTEKLTNKKYKYDLVLLSGELDARKFLDGDPYPLNSVDYKKQLLSPTDFVVEASINE